MFRVCRKNMESQLLKSNKYIGQTHPYEDRRYLAHTNSYAMPLHPPAKFGRFVKLFFE